MDSERKTGVSEIAGRGGRSARRLVLCAAVGLVGSLAGGVVATPTAWALSRPRDTPLGATAAVTAVAAMSYHNGPVLSPRIQCLMWGNFTATEITTNQQYLAGLAQFMSNHDLTGGVEPTHRQYGTWGGWFSGTCATDTVRPTGVVDEAAIQTEITKIQGRSTNPLAPYTPATVILVFTKGITMTSDYGTVWCAKHRTAGTSKYWGIIPSPTVAGCSTNFGLNTTQALQKLASHELTEAATDPDLATGWYAGDAGHEIADDCNNVFSTITLPNGTTGTINSMVDNIAQACTLFSPAQVPPLSVVKTGTNTINIFTQDASLMPRQISGDGVSWGSPQNRNGFITEAPSAISVDATTIDLFGRGTDGGIHRWFFDGSNWSGPNLLGGFAFGPPSAGFRTSRGKLVYFRGTDGVIYQISDGGINSWTFSSLTMPSGVLAISPPQVVTLTNDCLHIYFTGSNGHLYRSVNCTEVPTAFVDQGGVVLNRIGSATRASDPNRSDIFVDGPVIGGGAFPYQKTFTSTATSFNPLGGVIVGPPSAVALGASAIRLFGRGQGGTAGSGLFQDIASTGSNWAGWGQLDTVSISTAPLAFTPNGSAINVFLRRNDGALVQKRFDGVNWQAIQDLNLFIR